MILQIFYKCPRCGTNNTYGLLHLDRALQFTDIDNGCLVVCEECLFIYEASWGNYAFASRKSKSDREADYNQIDPMEE